MDKMRRLAILPIAILVLAACQSDTGGSATAPASASEAAASPSEAAVDVTNVVCVGEATTYLDWLNGDLEPDVQDPIEDPGDATGDLLETVQENGVLRISTDATTSRSRSATRWLLGGFDIDVGTEIANRLGVEVEFQHPDWEIITAGSWAERWDISVGSMTITTPRKDRPRLHPAVLLHACRHRRHALRPASPTSTTCRSDVRTAVRRPPSWLEHAHAHRRASRPLRRRSHRTVGRTSTAPMRSRPAVPSSSMADSATAADASRFVRISDPLYQENLAVAIDKAGPPHAALLYEIDTIIGDMHEDGTLTELSEEWFGEDLTQDPSERLNPVGRHD